MCDVVWFPTPNLCVEPARHERVGGLLLGKRDGTD